MYCDEQLNVVRDNEQYTAPNGTTYPAAYPKSEIPGIHKVIESPAPLDSGIVVTGFHIDANFNQVWDYRQETAEETKAKINAAIMSELAAIDQKSIRALREGDSDRIATLETQAANLRSQLIK